MEEINILILFLLLLMSMQDIKTMEVSNKLQILLFLIVLLSSEKSLTSIILAIGLCLMLYALFYKKKQIGGADIKILTSLTIVVSFKIVLLLMYASFIAIIVALVNSKKRLPFVPFITIGYICQILS